MAGFLNSAIIIMCFQGRRKFGIFVVVLRNIDNFVAHKKLIILFMLKRNLLLIFCIIVCGCLYAQDTTS